MSPHPLNAEPGTFSARVHQMITSEDDGRVCRDIPNPRATSSRETFSFMFSACQRPRPVMVWQIRNLSCSGFFPAWARRRS